MSAENGNCIMHKDVEVKCWFRYWRLGGNFWGLWFEQSNKLSCVSWEWIAKTSIFSCRHFEKSSSIQRDKFKYSSNYHKYSRLRSDEAQKQIMSSKHSLIFAQNSCPDHDHYLCSKCKKLPMSLCKDWQVLIYFSDSYLSLIWEGEYYNSCLGLQEITYKFTKPGLAW